MFEIPILYLAYNRPKITKTLGKILNLNPYKVYISVDGPKNILKDQSKVKEVKNIINKITKLKPKIKLKKNIILKILDVKRVTSKPLIGFLKMKQKGL